MSELNPRSEFIKDPRMYVQVYIVENNIQVLPSGGIKDVANRGPKEIFSTLYLDYVKDVQTYNANERNTKLPKDRTPCREYSEKILTMAFYEHISLKQAASRAELIDSLRCESENLDPIKQFVRAVIGKDSDADVAILAHWMWSIKTKMLGKLVTYHIMPIFYGPQGGGKTVAIRNLIKPIEDYKLNISMDQMTDERNYQAMSNNYVIFFDEMERADRVDVEALKKQVSIDYNDYRPLYTNSTQKVVQACSFIGATNRQVREQIVDATGMRRFWQMNCLPKLDWAAISAIDYKEMWKGVDENKEDGYLLSEIEEIRSQQSDLVHIDDLDSYIEFKHLTVGPEGSKTISFTELYSDYRIWAQDFGYKPLAANWFSTKLKGKGVERNKIKKDLWTVSVNFTPSLNNMSPDNNHLKAVK